jgi:hypothetical protein
MNILLVQEAVSAKPLNTMLHNILTFLYFLPHQLGLWIIKILQQLFPRIIFSDNLIDPLGFLIILTLFVVLARVAQKIAWIIVCLGWILLLIRILMIIFKLG